MKAQSAVLLAALAIASSFPAVALQRAFVSSTGNDANAAGGCTLAAPCRGFQAAHGAVDAGGEIVALDTAGYGAVTVSKSVTIMANPGVIAGISVSSGNGVTIATASIDVILRGLNISDLNIGAAGVQMDAGASLAIENCVISNFAAGVNVTNNARVRVVNSIMRGNSIGLQLLNGATAEVVGSQFLGNGSGSGIMTGGGLPGIVTAVSITDSVASGNATGFVADNSGNGSTVRMSCIRCTSSNNSAHGFLASASNMGSTLMIVGSSKATFNGQYGFTNIADGGGSTFMSLGDNLVFGLVNDTSGAISVISGR